MNGVIKSILDAVGLVIFLTFIITQILYVLASVYHEYYSRQQKRVAIARVLAMELKVILWLNKMISVLNRGHLFKFHCYLE